MIVELIANGVCAFAGAVAFAVLFSVQDFRLQLLLFVVHW